MDHLISTLALLLVFLLGGMVLYGYYGHRIICYRGRSRVTKLAKNGQVLRQMSGAEKEALYPILFLAGKRAPLELISNQVYLLEGEFQSSRFMSRSSGQVELFIGGVSVCLPYAAIAFIEDHNRAEVVLTPKRAFVISLNGKFSLMQGMFDQEQDNHFNRSVLNDTILDDNYRGVDKETPRGPVEIFQERLETAEEIALRRRTSKGIVAAGCLFAAFLTIFILAELKEVVSPTGLLIPLFLIAAAFFYRRRRGPKTPGKVVRLKGLLNYYGVDDPDDDLNPLVSYFLGHHQALRPPGHWYPLLLRCPDRPVTVEARLADQGLLCYEELFDLREEERLFPRRNWMRPIGVALVSLLACLVLLDTLNLPLDIKVAKQLISSPVMVALGPDQYDAARALTPGELVRIEADVRCWLPGYRAPGYNGDSYLDQVICDPISWGVAPKQLDPLKVTPLQLSFFRQDFIVTTGPVRTGIYDSSRHRKRYLIENLSATILAIDQLCTGPEQSDALVKEACHELKEFLLAEVTPLQRRTPVRDWNELLTCAGNEGLGKAGEDKGAVTFGAAIRLKTLSQRVVKGQLLIQARPILTQHQYSAKNGVLLKLSKQTEIGIDLWPESTNLLEQWDIYRSLSEESALVPLTLSGLVVANEAEENRLPVITVAEDFDQSWIYAAALKVFSIGLFAAIFICCGLVFIFNLLTSLLMARRMQAYYRTRIIERFGVPRDPDRWNGYDLKLSTYRLLKR